MADLFHQFFDAWEPHDYYKTPELEIPQEIMIIDAPHITMSHPFFNFDLEAACADIIRACEAEPDGRRKPLIAGLRGIGGGKTRTLEEIRSDLNHHSGMLALAITFNHNWGSNELYEFSPYKLDATAASDAQMVSGYACYSHGVIARMASVFFAKPFDMVLRTLHTPQFSSFVHDNFQTVIRSFVQYMISRLPRKITHFVLLVDETAKGDAFARDRFGVKDPTHLLRDGLLSVPIELPEVKDKSEEAGEVALSAVEVEAKAVKPKEVKARKSKKVTKRRWSVELKKLNVLHVGLVMTSLALSPIGQTLSNRRVIPLRIAESLSPQDILEQWWPEESPLSSFVVELAASIFADVPRLVEIAADILPDTTTVDKFLTSVLENLRTIYPGLRLPDAAIMYSMVFREAVSLNSEIMSLIAQSIFVNTITEFREESTVRLKSNLMVLIAAAPNSSETFYSERLEKMITFPVSLQQSGDILEILFLRWLSFRVEMIRRYRADQLITLETLLQLQGCSLLPMLTASVLGKNFIGEDPTKERLLHSSRKDPEGFSHELQTILVANSSVRMFFSAKDDAFDILLVFGQWVVFIDTKSREEDEKADTQGGRSWEIQAKDMRTFFTVNPPKWPGFAGWVYMYYSTHPVEPSFNQNVLTIGRSFAEKFFGPLWPCYRAFRAEWNLKKR